MRDDGHVFTCYSNMWDTIFFSELGSSLAILKGGYNLDSFMIRYQGVDWTDQASWECNGRRADSSGAASGLPLQLCVKLPCKRLYSRAVWRGQVCHLVSHVMCPT